MATYTWSKSLDNASASDDSFVFLGGGTIGGSTLKVQNPFHLGGESGERAVSVYNIPQVLQLTYVYQLSFGRGRTFAKNMRPWLDAIVGGRQTNAIIRFNKGRPIIPLLINSGTPIPTYNQRPGSDGEAGARVGAAGGCCSTDHSPGPAISRIRMLSLRPLLSGSAVRPGRLARLYNPAPETSTCRFSKDLACRSCMKDCAGVPRRGLQYLQPSAVSGAGCDRRR